MRRKLLRLNPTWGGLRLRLRVVERVDRCVSAGTAAAAHVVRLMHVECEMATRRVLDPKLADEDYCYLTTTGRVSGKPHTVEIWFGASGDTRSMCSRVPVTTPTS